MQPPSVSPSNPTTNNASPDLDTAVPQSVTLHYLLLEVCRNQGTREDFRPGNAP